MDYHNATSIPSHFGNVRLGDRDYLTRQLYNYSPIEYRLSYVNHLPKEVVVGWRSGMKFRLHPEPNIDRNELIARVEIILRPAVKLDIERVLSAVDETASHELQCLKKAYQLEFQVNKNGGGTIVLEYALTMEELKQSGGTIYFSELDCVISLMPFDRVPPHPYSEEGRRQQVVADTVGNGEVGFGYSVEIIDNSAKYGARYLNISGKVYRVTPKKDPMRRSGIYVTSNQFVDADLNVTDVVSKHYPFDSAEETLGLYRSYEEALHHGDMATARKHQLTELEHENVRQKAELVQARQRHELEMLEKEKQLKALSLEAERRASELKELREKIDLDRDIERQRVKDFYEDKSYVRKDSSETLKVIPAIVMGLGAVFMAVKALM